MRPLLTALLIALTFSACKKEGDDSPGSDVPYILTAFRLVHKDGDDTYQFQFDSLNRPYMVKKIAQGVTTGSALFYYDGLGTLTSTVIYNGEPAGTSFSTTEYYYNSDDQLTSEQTWLTSGGYCFMCSHEYEYDSEGRLKKYTLPNLFYRRFEYDDDDENPARTYVKPHGETTENLEFEFLRYDKKNPFFGVDPAMRTILRSMFRSTVFWTQPVWSNSIELPVPGMANNITRMKWHPRPHPQLVSLKREMNADFEYNADGYPTKATMTYSKQFEGSDKEVWTVYLTYQKLDP
jgi:hypothetical protein